MTKKEYRKLVRDRIPEIIEAEGRTCAIEMMDDEEYHRALLDKLVEESQEVAQATPKNVVTELADLYEVIDALLTVYGLGEAEVRALQQRRREDRGGFTQQIKLLWTE